MCKVSIIMGVYNCQSTLESCIKSILEQTYEDWELIMCDDGSNDDTYKIAKYYESKYPEKIKVLKNEMNMKLAATLNNCLNVAQGEYIARMDADDICIKNRLEKQVLFLDNNKEYAVVGTKRIIFDEDGEKGVRGSSGEANPNSMIYGVPFAHPTIMMRKDVYETLGGYSVGGKVTRCEDMELWFRFFKEGYRGYNLAEPLLKYRESLQDYKKRKIKYGIETSIIMYRGFRSLGYPKITYIYALKPIVSAIVPNRMMRWWHSKFLEV